MDDHADLRQRTVVGAVWSAVQAGGGRVLSVPVFIVLARLLAPADFGLASLSMTCVAIVLALQAGMPSAIVQREELTDDHLSSAFWSMLVLGTGVTVVTYVAAPALASVLGEPGLASVLRWMCAIPVLAGLDMVPQGLFLRRLDFKPLAVRSLASTAVGGGVGVAIALMGGGVWALVGKAVAEQATRTVVLWASIDYRPALRFSVDRFRELWRISAATLSSRMADVARERLDDLLVGVVLGATALGYYTVAYRLLVIFETMFVETTSKVSLPAFSRVQTDRDALVRAFRASIRLSSSVAFPAFVGLAAVAGLAVPVLFGEQWTPSVPAMRFLALAGLVSAPTMLGSSALIARGHARVSATLHVLQLLSTVAAILVVVRLGITAVAAAYAVGCLLVVPVWLRVLHRRLHVTGRELLADLLPYGAAATAMAAAVTVLLHAPATQALGDVALLAVSVLTGAGVYAGVLSVSARSRADEVLDVARVLARRAHPRPEGTP